jgi:hypothetical protein
MTPDEDAGFNADSEEPSSFLDQDKRERNTSPSEARFENGTPQ